ncbi:MAG TPA: hypothetical protein DF383_11475, partial [Deltaproteobacteria bacterium]|nr:hypothetical protein [Deltaproteobacteria bacterium]
ISPDFARLTAEALMATGGNTSELEYLYLQMKPEDTLAFPFKKGVLSAEIERAYLDRLASALDKRAYRDTETAWLICERLKEGGYSIDTYLNYLKPRFISLRDKLEKSSIESSLQLKPKDIRMLKLAVSVRLEIPHSLPTTEPHYRVAERFLEKLSTQRERLSPATRLELAKVQYELY